jgi:hypothetical protein
MTYTTHDFRRCERDVAISRATSCPRAVEDPGAVPACSHGEDVTLSTSGGGGVRLQPVSLRGTQPACISRLQPHFVTDAVCVAADLTLRYLGFCRQRLQVTALWDVSPGIFMVYDLFNHTVSNTGYIDSNDRPFNE